MESVLLLQNTVSKYGVLGSMTLALRDAFEGLGIRTELYQPDTPWTPELAACIQERPPDCTWSINVFVCADTFFWPAGIPHVNLAVDSWTYTYERAVRAPHLISLFVDRTSQQSFSARGGERAYWFPHAISQSTIDYVRSRNSIQLADRPYDVLMVGSFLDHTAVKREWNLHFDSGCVDHFAAIGERSLLDLTSLPLEEALRFIKQEQSIQEAMVRAELSPLDLANSVELYARGLERELLLKALCARQIHICTEKEDAQLWAGTEVGQTSQFVPSVQFHQVIDLCSLAKVVVHSAPHIRVGFHERLFLSLASGAVTLVGKGKLPCWLVSEGRVVEFDHVALNDLLDRIKEAEGRPYDKERILSWLESEHTWRARLLQTLPMVEQDIRQLQTQWHRQ